jgi:hypothetical protein
MGFSDLKGSTMKIAALITVAALVGGTAFANTSNTTAPARKAPAAAAADTDGRTHEGVGVKTKRALGKIGDKIRNTGNRLARATHTDKDGRADTRTMGAGPAPDSERGDAARRQRMDDAYGNYRAKQQR